MVPAIFLAAAIVVAIGYVNALSGRTLSLALLAMLVSLELVGCFGAAYLVGPDKPRCATAPADRIALAVLATGIILLLYFMNPTAVTTPDQGWRHLTLCCQLSTADALQHATPSRTA